MHEPFIFLSNPDEYHYTERWGSQGIEVVRRQGCHAIFGARVPFIPSFLTSDFTRTLAGGEMSRIRLITLRQIRFLNDLINARLLADGAVAFDLRFIAQPSTIPGQRSSIEIVFLGKAFHPNRNKARNLCWQLWSKFISHYPLEDPFNYPIEAIGETQLARYLAPLALNELRSQQVLEICKFEDFDPYAGNEAVGYFPHPFNPTFDAAALGRFLETLAQQQQICVVSICLQPTALLPDEVIAVDQMLSRYLAMHKAGEGTSWINSYRKERYDDLHQTFRPIINKRNHLFKMKIQVLGERYAPDNVLEALGSELIQNHTPEPRQWSRECPETLEDVQIAGYNFSFLEQRPWGARRADARLGRLRSLVSAIEASGAFRLPIPPESGYLPGLEVRDEPFVLPHNRATSTNQTLVLGEIIHRGQPSGQMFTIGVHDLTRHGLIAGATGSGKTNTCLHLLSQLWIEHQVPFLVMYPIDKPDYRRLMADPQVRDHLLVYTVGDETTSPFRFNPFHVPPGILLKTHMSQLMRCFSAAFSMWDPLPAIYRAAIRKAYAQAGWDLDRGKGGDSHTRTPTMAQFYDVLVAVADEMTAGYGDEVKGNVRQGAEIRIRDLLTNAGSVVNAASPAPMPDIISRPTVMELGRVGSPEDTALVMAFLLMQLVEMLQSRFKSLQSHQRGNQLHVTLVEEAHRLMSANHQRSEERADARAQGGEDFANILAEVRGFGEGILIAEQIPTQLVDGAMGNTNLKIMHRLEDHKSFELFAEVMNLDDRQRDYVRSLSQGQAIVRGADSRPVFVKVGNYIDQFQTADDRLIMDDSDEALRAFMAPRSVSMPPPNPWKAPAVPIQGGLGPIPPSEDPLTFAMKVLEQAGGNIPDQIYHSLPFEDNPKIDWSALEQGCRALFGHHPRFHEVMIHYLEAVVRMLRDSGVPVRNTVIVELRRRMGQSS